MRVVDKTEENGVWGGKEGGLSKVQSTFLFLTNFITAVYKCHKYFNIYNIIGEQIICECAFFFSNDNYNYNGDD